jgi:hypothetical protein
LSIRRIAIFVILMSVAPISAAPATVLDDISRDFAPLSGYVVMPADGEFLVDLDATNGIAVGDLFGVVSPGEKIVHPVSGKELGTLERVKGFLQITRIRPGYSHARPMKMKEEIRRGDVIRRFEHVPALFLDRTGKGKPFFDRLRSILPGFEWKFQEAAGDGILPPPPEGTLISFLLGPDTLEVQAPGAAPRTYRVSGEPAAATTPPTVPVPAPRGERKATAAVKEPAGRGEGDFVVRGTLPDGTLTADFCSDGNRLLLAVSEGTRIDVFSVGDNLAPVATGKPTRPGQILSLHWWQPQPGAPPLLAASVAMEENRAYSPAIGQNVMGALFAVREGRLVPIREEIPYLLGSFDRDGDGVRETLIGQSFDRDIFFGDRIRELRWSGNDLAIGEPSVPVSRPFAVQGALFADLTGDGRAETVFVRNRTLFVYDRTELLYESSQQMGGSLSELTYDLNPGAADRIFTTVAFEVPPVAVDRDGNGRMEVVAIASEGSGLAGIGSGIRKSRLVTLGYREGRFVRGPLGPELETPLQGLHASREGVFVVATHASSPFKPKKASHLLLLPWNSPTDK